MTKQTAVFTGSVAASAGFAAAALYMGYMMFSHVMTDVILLIQNVIVLPFTGILAHIAF